MEHEELTGLIRDYLSKGISPERVKFILESSGWGKREIDAAFSTLASASSSEPSTEDPLESRGKTIILLVSLIAILAICNYLLFIY
jgi:hypothetical protein